MTQGKIYKALGPNVFVREIKKEEKIGNFVIPDSINVDFVYGEVVSCAKDGYFEKGSFVPNSVIEGDIVMFAKISGTSVTFNGEKVIRVYAGDLIAKEIEGSIESTEEK